jgi:8-oxo-dGTP pyrophosphatase MutT (NUDIX family)
LDVLLGYVEDLRKIVGHRPLILVGAVVILIDEAGRILLQQRTHPIDTWGIPGGLMELGESTEEVARREVFEETGLTVQDLKLINVYSGSDNFAVAKNGDEFYVVIVAYYTESFEGKLIIDHTESVTVDFFEPERLPEKILKSHRIILNEFLGKHYRKK